MAFLFKVFSGSERLKERQKSADIVNETFLAELNDVQIKLEVENYELQMLVEMIYDSSYPESQKFLKEPTKDRLHAHKETISSLLFGLAAQGVSVAPLILTHFQKHGCDAIADTLIKLLELVRPLLASKDMPEFTSDDILDAIDNQWHSSVRSSPTFGSLRGSRAPSPLQSPRVSFSNLSPRQSFSSPKSPFAVERMLESSPGQIPPYGLLSPRNSQSFSFSPPSSLPDTGREGASATPPRRSLASHFLVGLSQSYGERLQPLAEHDEETNIGFGKFRSSISFGVQELSRGQSAGRTQVADDDGNRNDDDVVKKINETIVGILPLGLVRSRSNSFDKSSLVLSHEQSEKSVRGVNAEVPSHGSSAQVGGNKDTARNILESDVPFRDSFSSSNREGEIPEKDIVASSSSDLPTKRNHVIDSEQVVLEMNGGELNSTDDSLTVEEGVEEHYLHLSEDRVGVVKMIDVATPQVARKTQLQTAGDKHDECEEAQEAKDFLSPNTMSHDSSMPTLDQENIEALTDSPHAKEVEDEPDMQKEIAPARNSRNNCETIGARSSSLLQGTNSENTPLLNRSSSLQDTQVENFAQGEPFLFVQGAAVAELGCISWLKQPKSIKSENFEYTGDAGLADSNQNEMDKSEEETRKSLLGANNEGREEAVDRMEGDGDKAGTSSGMLSSASSVEDDKSLVSPLIEDKEESYSSGKSSIQPEGEVEAQEQESSHPSCSVEVGTDITSQSSFSDNYGDDGIDESSSSFCSSSPSDDKSSSSTSALSSDKRRSSSSPDDEMDDESSLPSVRPKGTEETTPSISVTDLDEDSDLRHLENGGQGLFGSDSTELLSGIEDESKDNEAEGTGVDEHVDTSELDFEQGAELHSPSYDSVTFELTKLSTDNNEDISSCFSLQSEDDEALDGTSEQVVTTKSTSCDDLHQGVNTSIGKGPASPSIKSAVSPSAVASGASLVSFSSQYEEGMADDITLEVVVSSKIVESQNSCSSVYSDAGVSADPAFDSKVAISSLVEQKEDAEGAGVIHSVTLHSENFNEDRDWKYLSEVETKEHKIPSHHDSDFQVSDGEGETAPPSQNVLEVELHMKDIEPRSPQQLPVHGSNQQVASENNSVVSLSSDVVTHSSLMGNYVEDGLPSNDLVQNASVMHSHFRDEEADSAELIVGESNPGGRKESFPNEAPDFQMAHNGSKAFFSIKALSNDFGTSSAMENGSRVAEHTEVNTSDDNHSQFAQDVEEQAVTIASTITDSEDSSREDHLLLVEPENHEVSTLASLEAKAGNHAGGGFYAVKLLSVRGEQYEANERIQQSVEQAEEKGSGAIRISVNHAVKDKVAFEVSSDSDEEAAVPSTQDDRESVLSDQFGPNSADIKAEGDKIGPSKHVFNQLISTDSEGMLARSNENGLKEHDISGTNLSSNLSSIVDGKDRNSLIDQVDASHHTECQALKSKLADGTPSNSVQFVEKVGVNDYEVGKLKHVSDVNLLPARRGEVSILSVDSSELALSESQTKENFRGEDDLQFLEHDHLLVAEAKKAGVAGANYMMPSNICDGNMIYPVEHGHNEGKLDKEKDLVVHVDEVSLPRQAEEVEGQDFKQVLDGVHLSNTEESVHSMIQENGAFGICDPTTNLRIEEGETNRPTEYEDGKETQAASEVLKLSAYGYESRCSRGGHPLEHTREFLYKIPPAPEVHVKGMSQQFRADSACLEKEELPIKGALLEDSRVALFKDEVGEASEFMNGVQTSQFSDALTDVLADEWEINNKDEAKQVEKGLETFLNIAEPAIEGTTEPILHTLERGAEHDEKDNLMGFVAEPTTYGIFLHNTKFLDSKGTFVKALTAPVTLARSTEVLQSGPERLSIRDSIICTPASSDPSVRKDQQGTDKNVRQRKYDFLRTLCCSRCSKPSTL